MLALFSYVDLVNVHLTESFLSMLPARMSQWIDPSKPEVALMERPDVDNSFVCFKVKEDIESYQAAESHDTTHTACTSPPLTGHKRQPASDERLRSLACFSLLAPSRLCVCVCRACVCGQE